MTQRKNETIVEGRADKERHPPSRIYTQHNHGGQLQAASQQYNIPIENWLDLSTGISPFVYPLPPYRLNAGNACQKLTMVWN